ncbi:MAG: hypothetical protein LBG11_11955 [Bifidobacteriaceae bacterium]|nr:hypothetical protein [Bifidobacteriaceae bacterium]
MEAFTHRIIDKLDDRKGRILASGGVVFGSADELLQDWMLRERKWVESDLTVAKAAPFEYDAPEFSFDILDDTGFRLDELRGAISICIHVDECGNMPSRSPRWLIGVDFKLEDYPAPVHRIVARIGDR